MSILKDLDVPPPQYLPRSEYVQSSSFLNLTRLSTLRTSSGLNPALWHKILSLLIDSSLSAESRSQGFSFLHSTVRRVGRELYRISMHLLRKQYLKAYSSRIQKPYSSNPLNEQIDDLEPEKKEKGKEKEKGAFEIEDPSPAYDARDGQGSSTSNGTFNCHSLQTMDPLSRKLLTEPPTREVRILDLFIGASLTVDSQAEESELIQLSDLDDLFVLYQPQSRLEDLIHSYGVQTSTLQSTPSIPQDQRICFSDLSIGFSRRNVSIRLPFLSANSGKSLRKVAVSVERARDQRLEHTARQLVVRLGECQLTRREDDGLVWYE